MGLGHGQGTGGGVGIFSYSQGARFTVNGVLNKTIMAYRPGREAPYFSSPAPIGPNGTPTGTADRDNARTLRETKDSVSKFRQ